MFFFDAKVMSLIDSVAMTQLLRLVRECNVMSSQKGAEVTDMNTEGSRDMDHTAQQQLSRVAAAAYAVLLELLQPIHGIVRETAAAVLRHLMPGLLGLSEPGAAPSDDGSTPPQRSAAAVRSEIIAFAKSAVSANLECREAVAALARYVVLKAPDKADFRSLAVDCAMQLTAELPMTDRTNFVVFAARLSRTAKGTPSRNSHLGSPSALEAATPAGSHAVSGTSSGQSTDARSLVDTAATVAPNLGEDASPAPCGTICLALLLQRCSDKSAAVRGKALANLAAAVRDMLAAQQGADSAHMLHCRQALVLASSVRMQHPLSNTPAIITPPAVTPAAADEPGATPMADTPQPPNSVSASGAPFVQKKRAGLHRTLLEHAYHGAAAQAAQLDLDVKALTALARKRCSDDKAGVRKAAAHLLEGLLLLRASGAGGAAVVLPSPADIAVVSVRKAALGVCSGLLRALPHEASLAALWVTAALPLVRDVEASLQEQLLDSFHDFVIVPAVAMSKDAGAVERLAPVLAALSEDSGAAAVCLGRACAQLKVKKRLKADKVAAAMQHIISTEGMAPEAVSGAWQLLAEVSAQDPSAPSWEFLQDAWERVKGRTAADGCDGDGALLLRVVAHAAGRFPPAQAAALVRDLLKAVQAFTLTPGLTAAHVLALAQLSAAGAAKSSDGWTAGVLAACERHLGAFVDAFSRGDASGAAAAGRQTTTAIFTAGEVVLLRQAKPSGRLVVLVQALTAPKLASNDAAHSSVPAPIQVSQGFEAAVTAVQAHAWVALGKLCLTEEATAKKCLPLFVQELGRASNPAVRNNIMVALTDLTVQYTALVDAHVPRLAACLADPHELFLRALVDDSARVRSLAEYLLTDTLSSKAPLLAYNHFVEALFVLNECRAGLHAPEEPLSQAVGGADARSAFSLAGQSGRAKRDTIYRALLRRMAPEHKFASAARLCSEVLSGFAEGTLPLDGAAEVASARGGAAAADEEEAGASAKAVEGAAKGRLVSAMMKKYLAEGMVPVLLELKRCLEAARHPLLGDLLAAFRALLRDHKSEIQDILAGDKQLAQEILYDLKHDAPPASQPAGATSHPPVSIWAAVEGPRERVAEVAQRPVRQPRGASRLAQHSFGSPASPVLNGAGMWVQAVSSTPASAGVGLKGTPASGVPYSAADFKTPGTKAGMDSTHSPSAAAGKPSMSVPRVRTGTKARPSRLGPGNPATPVVQQVHQSCLTNITLPSPARVDKVPKRWNIAEDTWKGGDSAKKATPAAKRGSGRSAHAADMQVLIEGAAAAALNEETRPQRKRKNAAC
ncbi:hypothetical protein COCSUDRAFT_83663 [Coccomyxa subellipsoidea C-169]|uniref:ARM repeat-containing protein n=1 Tax=Coccomyxa subellipsoidea (strain C-169) TaxID=574566 RepID=I0Z2V1_COCSC|nr:hypothetical protein COCSUDRAFT_83663 [Coccomyxa subellipsoidea C-169]EIE24970.1 hypothetical protein COCSUDRAFT_83663 [Coccomyxa subellipsoidea C-169]|eukprot:XP_005649514.1 hypothetical protein COCSUDRAFT_83663 [Coccomyxa subellipsoidea C-169]